MVGDDTKTTFQQCLKECIKDVEKMAQGALCLHFRNTIRAQTAFTDSVQSFSFNLKNWTESKAEFQKLNNNDKSNDVTFKTDQINNK